MNGQDYQDSFRINRIKNVQARRDSDFVMPGLTRQPVIIMSALGALFLLYSRLRGNDEKHTFPTLILHYPAHPNNPVQYF